MELEVCVIGNYKYWVNCAFKQVIPVFQTSDDSQEFPIIDRVSLFSCGESLGMVSAWAKGRIAPSILQLLVCLEENCACCVLRSIYFQDELLFSVQGNKDRF
jgi:hypothetical protein